MRYSVYLNHQKWLLLSSTITALLHLMAGVNYTNGADIQKCPKNCVCQYNQAEVLVTCQNATLKEDFYKHVPDNVTQLIITNSAIKEFTALNLKNKTRLIKININNNQLSKLPCSPPPDLPSNASRTLDAVPLSSTCMLKILPPALQHLVIQDNPICLDLQCLLKPLTITTLDVSNNDLSHMYVAQSSWVSNLTHFNVSGNAFTQIPDNLLEHLQDLKVLDLSNNHLQILWNETAHIDAKTNFSYFYTLGYLDISYNNISILNENWFNKLPLLWYLDISYNSLVFIPPNVFKKCSNLQELYLSHLPSLHYIDAQAFSGLFNLNTLILSSNINLNYIHSAVFRPLNKLTTLDLSHNSLLTIHIELLAPLTSLQHLHVHHNKWVCDCDVMWIQQLNDSNIDINVLNNYTSINITEMQRQTLNNVLQPNDIVCESSEQYSNLTLSHSLLYNHTCSNISIASLKQRTQFHIGSPAILNCDTNGDPSPHIIWKMPNDKLLEQHPEYISLHHGLDVHHYVPKHHGNDARIQILPNGSLYINYVERQDVGHYYCTAINPFGNVTFKVALRLDAIFRHKVNISFAVGLCSAIAFMFIGIIVAVLRYVAFKCSPEQRAKRKSIRQMLASLGEYRSEKYDRFSAYRLAKLDQFSAFKSDKVSKLKNAKKNLTVATLINYLHLTQENYTANIQHIRDNCTQQANHLRENYANQMSKIKGYKSEKVERIRDNYQAQANRIKEYGSQQLIKLREQYHLQQQHALKILEIMNIGNCLNVVEGECMKTSESLMFDDDLFDIDKIPGYEKCHYTNIQMMYTSSSTSNVSNYQTAGSDLENNRKTQNAEESNNSTLSNQQECDTQHNSNIKKHCRKKHISGQEVNESPISAPRKQHVRRKKRHLKKRITDAERDSVKPSGVALERDDSIHYLGDTEDIQQDSSHCSLLKPGSRDHANINSSSIINDTENQITPITQVNVRDIECGRKQAVQYSDRIVVAEDKQNTSSTEPQGYNPRSLTESYV